MRHRGKTLANLMLNSLNLNFHPLFCREDAPIRQGRRLRWGESPVRNLGGDGNSDLRTVEETVRVTALGELSGHSPGAPWNTGS